ncbi:MAG: hypothetical protein V3V08_07305 [Nannocystaceae bacterium]
MRLKGNQDGFTIWISAHETREWATRPSAGWPCSTLAGHRLRAEYDENGLLDLSVDGKDPSASTRSGRGLWINGNELSAIVADHCDDLPRQCAAWFVAVGQFRH